MRQLTPEIRAAIERAAVEEGVDPTLALAIAQRESNFDPRARNSKTIRGMFQMTGGLRNQYGIGDSDDPYTQAKGWARFIKDTKSQMKGRAGRDVSDAESYAGHHFGAGRAGKMMRMDPNTPVSAVFSPYEMSINPHFRRAGTVGNLMSSVTNDISRRQTKFGGAAKALEMGNAESDFSSLGEPVQGYDLGGKIDMASQVPDFTASSEVANLNTPLNQGFLSSASAADSAPDFSNFGTPVS